MTNLSSSSDVWTLEGNQAILRTPQLTASIHLLAPHVGLGQLVYKSHRVMGFVLGIAPNASESEPSYNLSDVFVRGNDLVATYAETEQSPFSLQVYWRATVVAQDVLLLDTILSLQTDLLESFPGLAVETKLQAAAAWLLSNRGEAATPIDFADKQPCHLPTAKSERLLLQSTCGQWSYAEMAHPEDHGESQIQRPDSETFLLQRQLGGRFLEKGVIRRLRVRGVFVPRENDLELAAKSLASLATELPPLTV